jgi:N6-adenosine-specific RNA methylase IME4
MKGALATGRELWAERITAAWRSTVEGIFAVGRLLSEAKDELAHGDFEAMIEADLPFKPSTARRLMIISSDERLSNRAHVHALPPHWGTLYELTKLPDNVFHAKLAAGQIWPEMQRKDVAHDGRREERLEEIAKGNRDLPTGLRYPIIYADPPWRYEHPPIGASNRSIENHYPTMTLEEICALPVSELAADDALLYLWATAPKLAECILVLEAWGFAYRTNLVWVKDKIGMGYHARNQHELLLVAKRGSIPPPAPGDRVSSVIHADRTEHSAKPAIFYELIERWYPSLPKIELFSRAPRTGWAAWGNQASEAA